MLRVISFCLCAPLAFVLALFYHQIWAAVLGLLYLGLSMQAEWAAGRQLAKIGEPELDADGKPKRRRHWSEDDPPDEELKVHPLGGAAQRESDLTYYPPPPVREATVFSPPPPPVRERDSRPPELRRLPLLPKFHGRDHEVLGVNENARTRTILNAFRHWIKRFHPDQARSLPAELANSRVQRLTEAKEHLLERRRGRKVA